MKQRLLIFAFGFIGWTIFFLIGRLFFLLYHSDFSGQLPLSDLVLTFIHGIRMDWAMAGYLCLLPGLMLAFTFFTSGKRMWPFWFGYHLLVLALASFIIVIDMELYSHWGIRLDASPLLYVGKEAAGSGELTKSILLLLFWLIFVSISAVGVYKFYKKRFYSIEATNWMAAPVLLVSTVLLIIPIRGSFGVAPMNTGFVYFHKTNAFANHAAINVVWNFAYAVQQMERLKYPEAYFDEKKTETYFSAMYPKSADTHRLIKDKPNVMIIILESYTFKFIEPLGGLSGIAPNFSALVKEGILFDNFYSSGDRTDKGLIAVLSAYPAQPLASIIKYPSKTKNLAFLNQDFKAMGYRTEFTYGYNIDYANFRSYLMNAQFDQVTHSEHFPQELNTSKWGVHDEFVFDKFFEEAKKAPQPFFKLMMTQSSHEPFEVPMETVIKGDDDESKFLNSAHYTDKELGEFIAKAKQTDWWNNTLIIITADHGHPMPGNGDFSSANRYKIPMLWLGGALHETDTVVHTLAGQTDIANTLLGQVARPNDQFIFSHDIFNPVYSPFAVFVFNNGFGFIQPGKLLVYDNIGKSMIVDESNSPEDLERGKSYMQKLYWDFNAR